MTLVVLRPRLRAGGRRDSRIRVLIIITGSLNPRPLGARGGAGAGLELPSPVDLLPQFCLEGRKRDPLTERELMSWLIGINRDAEVMQDLCDEADRGKALLGVGTSGMHVAGDKISYV